LHGKHVKNGIYDFGENISGWARIKAEGEAGREISLDYSERLGGDGHLDKLDMNRFTNNSLKHCDKYIMLGKGIEEWAPRFLYHGFRYVQVKNAPRVFEIKAEVVHTDLKTVGNFECSDPKLNKIHDASLRSTLTNFHSIPTDCPHREQNGWTGDALMSAEQALLNFDMTASYKKWLNDFKDVQRPDGQLPGIVPTSSWGYNWGSGPAWDSAMIQIPWLVYLNTGDASLIRQMWENMNRYMGYLACMSEGFLVDFGLGDQQQFGDTATCPLVITDTAFYYADALIMSKCAKILGKPEKVGEYALLAENVKAAYRKAFMNNVEPEKSQIFLVCSIYNGLYNEDEIPQKAAALNALITNNGCRTDCGSLGTKFMFNALTDSGYGETAYKMVTNPKPPSYAYWINSGMTTLCEGWEMKNSLNHHWFSEVDHWFYRHLAGIQITPEMITIKPCFIPQIQWVRASHRDITVAYASGKLEITVPRPARVILNGKIHEVNKGSWQFDIS
jgi:alpha-L-rhamnosidase